MIRLARRNALGYCRVKIPLSEMITPPTNLERIFPKTAKRQHLDEKNIETQKGLGYIE